LFKCIKSGKFAFPPELWSQISPQAKSIVKELLRVDPVARLSSTGALSHPWVTGEKKVPKFVAATNQTTKKRALDMDKENDQPTKKRREKQ
jgi:serine/threonine protein kinase